MSIYWQGTILYTVANVRFYVHKYSEIAEAFTTEHGMELLNLWSLIFSARIRLDLAKVHVKSVASDSYFRYLTAAELWKMRKVNEWRNMVQ